MPASWRAWLIRRPRSRTGTEPLSAIVRFSHTRSLSSNTGSGPRATLVRPFKTRYHGRMAPIAANVRNWRCAPRGEEPHCASEIVPGYQHLAWSRLMILADRARSLVHWSDGGAEQDQDAGTEGQDQR